MLDVGPGKTPSIWPLWFMKCWVLIPPARRLRRREVSHFNAESKQLFDWSMGWNYLAWGRGEVQAGDKIERLDRDGNGITVEDIVCLYAFEQGDLEMLRRAVRVASLPEIWRDYFRHQLKERGG